MFDNATGVGRRVGEEVREAELFKRFRAHDNFSIRFCNPNSGYDKGHVETKVRYDRNNLFVPIPAYEEIVAYNQNLLAQHENKAKENHYKKQLPINLLPLSKNNENFASIGFFHFCFSTVNTASRYKQAAY